MFPLLNNSAADAHNFFPHYHLFSCFMANVVRYSSNALNLLHGARTLALQYGHDVIGTEHFVLSLCNHECRAIEWIARVSYPDATDPEPVLKKHIKEWLLAQPYFKNFTKIEDHQTTEKELSYSDAMSHALDIAQRIGSGPVQDGDYEYKQGLIASEFLLAALLVEGTGLGVEALTRASSGKVNSFTLLQEINCDPDEILLSDESEGSWSKFSEKHSKLPPKATAPWFPDFQLSEIKEDLSGPTYASNWLIPGRLLIGERPDKTRTKFSKLLGAGVNTFVSLIGEYDLKGYRKKYPMECRKHAKQTIHFIHFPIRDYSVTEPKALAKLVKLLQRKLLKGNCVYIHCRGGHGLVFCFSSEVSYFCFLAVQEW